MGKSAYLKLKKGIAVLQYLYNRKEKLEGIGLYDYGARMYDASIGRFTTVDLLADVYYPINPYVYTNNNPISNVDPTGIAFWKSKWLNDNVGHWTDGNNTPKKSAPKNPISFASIA